MNIYQKLSNIQNEMNVPKNLYNKFGNYSYRNAESILEEAKPICAKHGATLIVSDEIIFVEGRHYVKATARLYDWETDQVVENVGLAREEENKKGMDSSQLTGSTSSYARKYALNGLFSLDDNKDADSEEQKVETTNRIAKEKVAAPKKETPQVEIIEPKPMANVTVATVKQVAMIKSLYNDSEIATMTQRLGRKLEEITVQEASKMINARKQKTNE